MLLLLACGREGSSPGAPPPQPQVTTAPGTIAPTVPACDPATVTAGNSCCTDGTTRPDCTLAAIHIGYWELPCPAPQTATCTGIHTEDVTLPAGQLTVIYTTGTFHVMPGRVTVTLDGTLLGVSSAALPGGTANSPLPPAPIAAGAHQLALQFSSTDGQIPGSWGGFIDLYVN